MLDLVVYFVFAIATANENGWHSHPKAQYSGGCLVIAYIVLQIGVTAACIGHKDEFCY